MVRGTSQERLRFCVPMLCHESQRRVGIADAFRQGQTACAVAYHESRPRVLNLARRNRLRDLF